MGVSRSVTSLWTLPYVNKSFIRVIEKRFWTDLTDGPGLLPYCYVEDVLDNGQIYHLGELTEKYEAYENVE